MGNSFFHKKNEQKGIFLWNEGWILLSWECSQKTVAQGAKGNIKYLTAVNDRINGLLSSSSQLHSVLRSLL